MTVGVIATEFDEKANAGLPGPLPVGERIVWQGNPRAAAIARHSLKVRWIAGYFAVMLAWLVVTGLYFARAPFDIAMSLAIMALAGGLVIGLAHWLAWGVARTTTYTITTRRIVMRFGIALPKAFNLPYSQIESVDVRERGHGLGEIALRFKPGIKLNWFIFWPHVRGLRMGRMEPQLIGIADIGTVASLLATQLHANFGRTQHPGALHDVHVDRGEGTAVPFPQAAE